MDNLNERNIANRGCCVLVVGEDPRFASRLSTTLGSDYDVLLGEGSRQALTCMQDRNIQVVFVDLDLPPFLSPFKDNEGIVLTRLLTDYHSVPVVILTGSTDPVLLKDCAIAGAASIQSKDNMKSETLLSLVRRHGRGV